MREMKDRLRDRPGEAGALADCAWVSGQSLWTRVGNPRQATCGDSECGAGYQLASPLPRLTGNVRGRMNLTRRKGGGLGRDR